MQTKPSRCQESRNTSREGVKERTLPRSQRNPSSLSLTPGSSLMRSETRTFPGNVAPGPATQNAVLAAVRASRVALGAGRVIVLPIPVVHPFPNVPQHVVKIPRRWRASGPLHASFGRCCLNTRQPHRWARIAPRCSRRARHIPTPPPWAAGRLPSRRTPSRHPSLRSRWACPGCSNPR